MPLLKWAVRVCITWRLTLRLSWTWTHLYRTDEDWKIVRYCICSFFITLANKGIRLCSWLKGVEPDVASCCCSFKGLMHAEMLLRSPCLSVICLSFYILLSDIIQLPLTLFFVLLINLWTLLRLLLVKFPDQGVLKYLNQTVLSGTNNHVTPLDNWIIRKGSWSSY